MSSAQFSFLKFEAPLSNSFFFLQKIFSFILFLVNYQNRMIKKQKIKENEQYPIIKFLIEILIFVFISKI